MTFNENKLSKYEPVDFKKYQQDIVERKNMLHSLDKEK